MSDKLKMHSPNLVDANIEKISALFPNCITETKDENGELKKAVDFDLLKQELSQILVEGEQERYRLDWVGKKEAILTAKQNDSTFITNVISKALQDANVKVKDEAFQNILSQYITTGSSSSTDQGTTETATTETSDK